MKEVLADIQSGKFTKEWMDECKNGQKNFLKTREKLAEHPVEKVGARLRAMMPWIAKKKLVEVEKLTQELQDKLREARQEASRVVTEAEKESDQLYQEAVGLAQSEANELIEKSRAELALQQEKARQQLSKDADNLSELIVNRLISAK